MWLANFKHAMGRYWQQLVALFWLLGWCGVWAHSLSADPPPSVAESSSVDAPAKEDAEEYFDRQVLPILSAHCFECHSEGQKRHAGLSLETREGLVQGGDSGQAIVPGDPANSLLIQAVRYTADSPMPPDEQLAPQQIAVLEQWIRQGAIYSTSQASAEGIAARMTRAAEHWAFKPWSSTADNSSAPTNPSVSDRAWVRNEIDLYILTELEKRGLRPAEEAERSEWLRRVALDLTGIPPAPAEIAAFLADEEPDAYERQADRLLASPQYGERWGRHWLDLARYADSSGFHNDLDRPWAWKYRDYVIQSFNQDKPYARFVAEQLAGDEVSGADQQSLIATGFCRNGPSNEDNMGKTQAALKQYRADQLDDVVSTASSVFLGITLGCARCHDHKTDPFTARDYYSLVAIFNGTQPFGQSAVTKKKAGAKQDAQQQVQALIETQSKVPATFVMRRGQASNLGEEVEPAVPQVLAAQRLAFPQPASEARSSLRRQTLAAWICAPDNALAWRVLANRMWHFHFGRGLVETPSNFGFSGAAPTHPELLEFLASRLMHNGGQWKPLHRLIVTSATYRQSSRVSAPTLELDPTNQWWSRVDLRRMDAEVLRDSLLTVSGALNTAVGGPGIKPRLPQELIPTSQRNKWPDVAEDGPEQWRRSVYVYAKRQLLLPILELFDAPTTTDSCAVRLQSVVPTQALVLMNDEFVEQQANLTAARLWRECAGDVPQAVQRLFLLAVGHPPSPARLEAIEQFIVEMTAQHHDAQAALADVVHVLFNSSEFVYIQ